MYYREMINQKLLVYGVYDNVLTWQISALLFSDMRTVRVGKIIYENGLKLWFGCYCGLSEVILIVKLKTLIHLSVV